MIRQLFSGGIACIAILAGFIVAPAQAQIVIEPDNFADGTNISTTVPGITLSLNGTGNIFASTISPSSTGTNIFNSDAGPTFDLSSPFAFRADFSFPVTSVSLDFINNDAGFGPDVGTLEIYNASSVLLATVDTSVLANDGDFQTLTLSRPQADIAFIRAGGNAGTSDDIYLDHLVVTAAAPEPGSLAFLGMAALPLIGMVRRRK